MTDFSALLPPPGSLIRFTRLPTASWASVGETYRVRYAPHFHAGKKGIHPTTSIRLWNEDRDCGTFDNARNWIGAQWEIVQ